MKGRRMEGCSRNEAARCRMPSPSASSPSTLVFVAPSIILPLCIPLSIHDAVPPSMSLSPSSCSGMQPSWKQKSPDFPSFFIFFPHLGSRMTTRLTTRIRVSVFLNRTRISGRIRGSESGLSLELEQLEGSRLHAEPAPELTLTQSQRQHRANANLELMLTQS